MRILLQAVGIALILFVGSPRPVESALPPAPANYTTVVVGQCQLVLPQKNLGLASSLERPCASSASRIYAQLGVPLVAGDAPPVEVRIAASPEHFSILGPPGARLPDWTGAVAFPDHNLIILPLYHQDGRSHTELDVVLEHEMSHVAFRLASGGARVPRWFSEGVAILQSEGSSMGRSSAIWWASLRNDIRPLSEIDRYPRGALSAEQAYAQAADFTAFLLNKQGWESIRHLLRRLRSQPFHDAFVDTYGVPVTSVERQWRDQLFGSTAWVVEVTGDGLWLGFAALVCIAGFFIVRRRKRKRLAEMEEEERPLENIISSLEKVENDKRRTLN